MFPKQEIKSLKDKCVHCKTLIIKIGDQPWKHATDRQWNVNCDRTIAYPSKKSSTYSSIGTVDTCASCGSHVFAKKTIRYRILVQCFRLTNIHGNGWLHVESNAEDCTITTKATPTISRMF